MIGFNKKPIKQEKIIFLDEVVKFTHAGFEIERQQALRRMFWPWRNLDAELREKKKLFSGLQLEVSPGETISISGDEGAGKTVLAKLIAGLAVPDSGRLVVKGRTVLLPHHPVALTPFITFYQYVALYIECLGISSGKRKDIVDSLCSNESLLEYWRDRAVEVPKDIIRSVCNFIALHADMDIYLFDGRLPIEMSFPGLDLSHVLDQVIAKKTILILSRPEQIPVYEYSQSYFLYDGKLHFIELQNKKHFLPPVLSDSLLGRIKRCSKNVLKKSSSEKKKTTHVVNSYHNAVLIKDIEIISNKLDQDIEEDGRLKKIYTDEGIAINAVLKFDGALHLPAISVMQLWSNNTLLYATRSPVISADHRGVEEVVGVVFSPNTMRAMEYTVVFFVSIFEDGRWHLCDKAKSKFRVLFNGITQEDDFPKRPIDLGVVDLKGDWEFYDHKRS